MPALTSPPQICCLCSVRDHGPRTPGSLLVPDRNGKVKNAWIEDHASKCRRLSLSSREVVDYPASSTGHFEGYRAGVSTTDDQVVRFRVSRKDLYDPKVLQALYKNLPEPDCSQHNDMRRFFEKNSEILTHDKTKLDKMLVLLDTAALWSTMTRTRAKQYGFPADKQLVKPGDKEYGMENMYCAHGDLLPHYGRHTIMLVCDHSGSDPQPIKVSVLVVPDEERGKKRWPDVILGQIDIYIHGLLPLL